MQLSRSALHVLMEVGSSVAINLVYVERPAILVSYMDETGNKFTFVNASLPVCSSVSQASFCTISETLSLPADKYCEGHRYQVCTRHDSVISVEYSHFPPSCSFAMHTGEDGVHQLG